MTSDSTDRHHVSCEDLMTNRDPKPMYRRTGGKGRCAHLSARPLHPFAMQRAELSIHSHAESSFSNRCDREHLIGTWDCIVQNRCRSSLKRRNASDGLTHPQGVLVRAQPFQTRRNRTVDVAIIKS